MTTYAASISPGGTIQTLSISPSTTFQVRIARIEFSGSASAFSTSGSTLQISWFVNVSPSATMSGGTTITPFRMRSGAPAATATVKSGITSSTGTFISLHSETTLQVQSDISGTPTGTSTLVANLNSTYSTPFDLILSNGSIFSVGSTASSSASMTIVVYFEELRLAWTS